MTLIKNLALFGLLAFLAGCASNSTIAPDISTDIENPASGETIKIVEVNDDRVFAFKRSTPEIPSLSEDVINGPADQRQAIKDRAIGGKRNKYGKYMGVVLLPEGHTVEGVIQDSLENAFRKAGYRVSQPGDPDYSAAVPVTVDIKQFWTWIDWSRFEAWRLDLRTKSEIDVTAPMVAFEDGKTIDVEYVGLLRDFMDIFWRLHMTDALADLTSNAQEVLEE